MLKVFSKIFTTNVLAAALSFLTMVVISRLLTITDFGRFGYVYGIMFIIQSFIEFGTSNGSVVFLGKKRECNFDTINQTSNVLIILFSTFILTTIAITSIGVTWLKLNTLEIGLICSGALLISINKYVMACFQANENWDKYNLTNISNNAIKIATFLFAFILSSELHYEYKDILIFWISYTLISMSMTIAIYGTQYAIQWTPRWRELQESFLGVFAPIAVINVIITITLRADIIIAERILSSNQVALYFAANTIAMIVPLATIALSNIYLQKASTNNQTYIKEIIKQQAFLIPIAVIAYIIISLASDAVINLAYGYGYEQAKSSLLILVAGYLGGSIFVPLEAYFYATNRFTILKYKIITCIVLISICPYLASNFGVEGIAIAVVISKSINWTMIGIDTLKMLRRNNV